MELLRRYSNRLELINPLEDLLRRAGAHDGEPDTAPSSVEGQHGAATRLVDRLSEDQIQALVSEYQAGATIREVAERYGFGTTAVKRLLRRRGARKYRR